MSMRDVDKQRQREIKDCTELLGPRCNSYEFSLVSSLLLSFLIIRLCPRSNCCTKNFCFVYKFLEYCRNTNNFTDETWAQVILNSFYLNIYDLSTNMVRFVRHTGNTRWHSVHLLVHTLIEMRQQRYHIRHTAALVMRNKQDRELLFVVKEKRFYLIMSIYSWRL